MVRGFRRVDDTERRLVQNMATERIPWVTIQRVVLAVCDIAACLVIVRLCRHKLSRTFHTVVIFVIW